MADGKFIELLFEPEIDPTNTTRHRLAYQSLVNKPQQLFLLLLEKETASVFFSGLEFYGKQLAKLLEKSPEYIKPTTTPERQPHFKEGDIKLWIYEEVLGVFLFSLLANDYPDIASQEAMADIVMAVIKLTKPRKALELIGTRLGEVPLILSRMITGGSIGNWSRDHPESFKHLVSDHNTPEAWARTTAGLAGLCVTHYGNSRNVRLWEKIRDLVRSFPCDSCKVISSTDVIGNPTGNVAPRRRDFNPYKLGSNLKTFDNLLGEHLGPWKITLSVQALKDLKGATHSGTCEIIRRLLCLYHPTNIDKIQGYLTIFRKGFLTLHPETGCGSHLEDLRNPIVGIEFLFTGSLAKEVLLSFGKWMSLLTKGMTAIFRPSKVLIPSKENVFWFEIRN